MSDQKTIRIMCPDLSCQRVLSVPTDARGKLVRCRRCGMTIRVPMARLDEPKPQETAQDEAA